MLITYDICVMLHIALEQAVSVTFLQIEANIAANIM